MRIRHNQATERVTGSGSSMSARRTDLSPLGPLPLVLVHLGIRGETLISRTALPNGGYPRSTSGRGRGMRVRVWESWTENSGGFGVWTMYRGNVPEIGILMGFTGRRGDTKCSVVRCMADCPFRTGPRSYIRALQPRMIFSR